MTATALLPLAQQHSKMRPVGRLWWGLCPLHGERTPSFYVNPEKDRWYCFGCGKGGDAAALRKELAKHRRPK